MTRKRVLTLEQRLLVLLPLIEGGQRGAVYPEGSLFVGDPGCSRAKALGSLAFFLHRRYTNGHLFPEEPKQRSSTSS